MDLLKMQVIYNKTSFLIGRSASENWDIITKADKEYYWVHAHDVPSSHIIIEIDEPLEDEIQYACKLCKSQSKKAKNQYVITKVKNIKLGSTPGEVYFKNDSLVKKIDLI
jgi:predicted ribosome quality control (RQC) complex YloA/Tae2 family protein